MKKELRDTSIVLVGAGNLATNLAKALRKAGFAIAQVYSRTLQSASALAEVVDAEYTTDIHQLKRDADWYIVSLKDSVFVELIGDICQDKKQDALFVHTAGSVPMSIWQGYANYYGVFYPLQTFSKKREVDFKEIPFFIEASTPANCEWLKEVAQTMSDKVYEATSEQRKSLHLAAVFTCNFTNHMYALAADLLEKYDLPFEAMLPLIDETARKVHELAPREAQTGPAIRYDEEVIDKHLQMLEHDEQMRDLYERLSRSIHLRSKE